MIKAYVLIEGTWRRIYNLEGFSLTSEIGGRIPSFSFSVPDKRFYYSPFNTASPYRNYLKKGNKVKMVKDGLTIAVGHIDQVRWSYPNQVATVQCRGVLGALQEDKFGGEDWSFESGSFSQTIPQDKVIDLSSTGATAVWGVKVNDSPFSSYEWNLTERKLVITSDVSGTISGKYLTQVSPHVFLSSLLSGYDFACVPLVSGTTTYVFSASNLISGATIEGLNENLQGTGEIVTRPIDLGRYTEGFGQVVFNIDGLVLAQVRGGDERNMAVSNAWRNIASEADLNSVFGRFVRFVQFRFVIEEGAGENNHISIVLTGNAPVVQSIKLENDNKLSALQKFVECYQCFVFEDRFGTIRIEHKEAAEDWQAEMKYLQFSGMDISGVYSPRVVVVNGLEQRFTLMSGPNAGAECVVRHKGSMEFAGEDLSGELSVNNGLAWDDEILQNVGLCYQPPPTKIRVSAPFEYELGDLVKVQTVYLEAENIVSRLPFVDVSLSKTAFRDIEDTAIPFISTILAEANAIYRVSAKIYRDEVLWEYELEEVFRFPFLFTNLDEWFTWVSFGPDDDIVLPNEPDTIWVWDGEDWDPLDDEDWDYNPDTGEVDIPGLDDTIHDEPIPDEPIPGTDIIPDDPIVVVMPQPTPEPEHDVYYQPPYDSITPYFHRWDVWNCDYPLHTTPVEKRWWVYKAESSYRWGRRIFTVFDARHKYQKSNNPDQICFEEVDKPIVGRRKEGDHTWTYVAIIPVMGDFEGRPYGMVQFYKELDQSNKVPPAVLWSRILQFVRSQGKSVQYRKSPDNRYSPSFHGASRVFEVYTSDGREPTYPDEACNLTMRLYAITSPIPPIITQEVFAGLQKVYLTDVLVHSHYWYFTKLYRNVTEWRPIPVDQYPLFEALINNDIPWYGILLEPAFTDDYYVLCNAGLSIVYSFNLDTDAVSTIDASGGVLRWHPGYSKLVWYEFDTGVHASGWPDKPEYPLKLWRGFTFEVRMKYKASNLDESGEGFYWYALEFADGAKRRNFTLWFVSFYDWDYSGDIFVFVGDNYYREHSAIIPRDTWFTWRVVLLGVMKFLNINPDDGITEWDENGNFLGFKEEANTEYFKDVHDSQVRWKEDPDFQGYAAVYVNEKKVWEGTLDDAICTWSSTNYVNKRDYCFLEMGPDPYQEGSFYIDYVKMAGQAFDIQSGADVVHLVVKK